MREQEIQQMQGLVGWNIEGDASELLDMLCGGDLKFYL